MATKILAITHKNFVHLFHEVVELLNLPLILDVLEVNFGELHKIDNELFPKYDLVITSGAHMEMINNDYYELTYLVPFYPLQFTESDLVKCIVQAKEYGNKMMLMYFPEENYNLEQYEKLLNIEMIRLPYSNLEEAERLMMEYYHKGFNVVIGSSSVCEVANKRGINNVFIYSKDSLKLEIIKAYQFANTKNKMVNFAKVKDAILQHAGNPIYLLDQSYRIIDTNGHGLSFVKKKAKHELIGERIQNWLNLELEEGLSDPIIIDNESEQIIIEPAISSASSKTYIVIIKGVGSGSKMNNRMKQNATLNSKYKFTNIIHDSQEMKKIILKTKQFAQSDAPLFINGESGTGKELIAHSVHHYSDRKNKPFLPVNCSAIPQNILESELFGYEEGAFTGAIKGGKPGFFEMAQNGTIFLDEIGELPLDIQTKLLRVLQEKEVIRLGGNRIIPLDVRIITATNKSLPQLIKEKLFREDLYYRINVLQINVPPVRERKEDIPLILHHLLVKYGLDSNQVHYLINIARDSLMSYNWPGNVREMENLAQRFCALNSISNTTYDLVKSFTDIVGEFLGQNNQFVNEQHETDGVEVIDFTSTPNLEKLRIMEVLLELRGNKQKAAEKLGMSRTTLWRKIKQYRINTGI